MLRTNRALTSMITPLSTMGMLAIRRRPADSSLRKDAAFFRLACSPAEAAALCSRGRKASIAAEARKVPASIR
ncbi:hypothetical protein D3C73_1181520 [compost metagenome]